MNIQSELPKSGAMWQRHLMITYLYWFCFLTVINVHQTTCPSLIALAQLPVTCMTA